MLGHLSDGVQPGSLTTLLGPGGVGKSTLARALCDHGQVPTAWASLDGVRDADEALLRIAEAL